MGKFSPQFSGYGEILIRDVINSIIDLIHEDFNLILKKPYIDHSQIKYTSDKEAGESYWSAYLKRNNSFIYDAFNQQTKSVSTCTTCNKRSVSFDPFILIEFHFDKNNKNLFSLDECFYNYPTPVNVQEYYCSGCKDFKEAIKTSFFWSFPQYLILSFKNVIAKRFFEFPDVQLDLTPYVEVKDRFYLYEIVSICETRFFFKIGFFFINNYLLFGTFRGSEGGGHSVCKVNKNGKWYLCDDSTISLIEDTSGLITTDLDTIFLKRKKTGPYSFKNHQSFFVQSFLTFLLCLKRISNLQQKIPKLVIFEIISHSI